MRVRVVMQRVRQRHRELAEWKSECKVLIGSDVIWHAQQRFVLVEQVPRKAGAVGFSERSFPSVALAVSVRKRKKNTENSQYDGVEKMVRPCRHDDSHCSRQKARLGGYRSERVQACWFEAVKTRLLNFF